VLVEEGAVFRSFGLLITSLVVLGATACSTPAPGEPTAPAPSAAPTPESHAPAVCGTGWGSVDETVAAMGPATVVAVRSTTEACADRVEFEVDGPAAGYTVSYVDAVVQDGSGDALPVPGGARLQVQLHHPAYNDAGQATLPNRAGDRLADVTGYPTVQAIVFAGSFEGYSSFGVGVRARLPYQVTIAPGPGRRSRIVLEVAHRWS
jgi:hypothetical protein